MALIQAAQTVRAALPAAYRRARKETGGKKLTFTGTKPSFILYSIIGVVALLKDALDFVLLAAATVLGPASLALGTVITFCFNTIIFFLFLLDRSGGRKRSNRLLIRALILIILSLIEGFGYGFNFIPLQTIVVTTLYFMALRSYRKEKKKEEAETTTKTKKERLAETREMMMLESMQAEAAAAQVVAQEAQVANQRVGEQQKKSTQRAAPMAKDVVLPVPQQGFERIQKNAIQRQMK